MSIEADRPAGGRFSVANLPVNVKILAAVCIAGLVALAVGVSGLAALGRASAAAQQIYSTNVANVAAVGDIKSAFLQVRVDVTLHAASSGAAAKTKVKETFTKDVQAATAAIAAYRSGHPAGDQATIQSLTTEWQQYSSIAATKLIPLSELGDMATWQTVRTGEANPHIAKAYESIAALRAAESQDAERSAAAARSGYQASRLTSLLLLIIGLVVALAAGVLVARQIVRSLSRVKDVCAALAEGDLTRTAGLTARDEPGQMGQSLDTAVVRLRATVTTISGSATSLAGAAEELSGVTTQISSSAEETSAQAQTVSAAAEQISRSIDTVSAGSEEMGASIKEISQNATEAAQVAQEAVTLAATTSDSMNKLGESSAEIGNVVKVITAIAEQTNLLALNATIEAARAGELGKGFAVVASEVKDLAQETARATEDISRRVEVIQADTGGAVTAIEQISRVIARISDFQTTIASAVEEQTATTGEMNRSVTEAATGAGDVAQNITGVADAARLTSEGVNQAQQATAELTRMSSELATVVAQFRY
ncbi:methyl-accepting chemotaxis protein [Actinoplanes sp. NPDC051513]|uniref:methyl-accepting chemotaxis protein n=1 Tax=Actinoplanes sp. NPDC051513 TaxID=3363908 RepID=UPI003789BBD1